MIEPITAETMARNYLAARTGPARYLIVTPWALIAEHAELFGVTIAEFIGPKRHRAIAHARQDCMAEIFNRTDYSMSEIGRLMGGRDHTTIKHGIDAAEKRAHQRKELTV